MNKKIIISVVTMVVVAGIFLVNKPENSYRDVLYNIGGKKMSLKSGDIQYFGNEVRKDLDGDGREDIAFIVTKKVDGGGILYYLVGALNTQDGYVGSDGVLLGDRIAPQTTESGRGKIVVVNFSERKLGEDFNIPPSLGKSLWLLLDAETMQFGQVAQDFEGEQDLIFVELPEKGSVVGKDFSVIGKARGNWFFEASFPIKLLDKDGKLLYTAIAQAEGDWMTTDFVPFKAEIHTPVSYIGPATLVLEKDNPSGLPEHDASISFNIIVEY